MWVWVWDVGVCATEMVTNSQRRSLDASASTVINLIYIFCASLIEFIEKVARRGKVNE